MNSKQAIDIVLSNLRDQDIAFFTTGYISRYAFSYGDRMSNFYMIGSMGLVSPVALGAALNTSKKVFIFDGDGSLLMNMGAMAMVANHKPENLFHIVLDNEAYESTGSQPSISRRINFSSIAKAMGYKHVSTIDRKDELRKRCSSMFHKKGPYFLHVKLGKAGSIKTGRVSIDPETLSQRIRKKIKEKDV